MSFFSNLFTITPERVASDVRKKSIRIIKTILLAIHTFSKQEDRSKLDVYRMALSSYPSCNEAGHNTFIFKDKKLDLDENTDSGDLVYFLMQGSFERKLEISGIAYAPVIILEVYKELRPTILENGPYQK